jgi:hypothetical protein
MTRAASEWRGAAGLSLMGAFAVRVGAHDDEAQFKRPLDRPAG